VSAAHYRACWRHRPRPFPGKLLLLRAAEQPPGALPDLGASVLAREVEVVEVPGNHQTLLREPQVGQVAEVVKVRVTGAG